jgi:aminopeptidase
MDLRVERLASVLVNYSARIGHGDRALIEGEPAAMPLIQAVYRRVLEAGGNPYPHITSGDLDVLLLKLGADHQLDYVPELRKLAYETFESRIFIRSSSNTRALTEVDPRRQARRNRALEGLLKTQFERGGRGEFRWVSTLFPTQAFAQEAEMSFEDYEAFVFDACHVDEGVGDPVAYWEGVKKDQARVIERLARHDRVVIRGPECDLSLSIKGRTFLNGCGPHNMPDGEIYTGPVEDSVKGWVRFSYPAIRDGRVVEGIELKFEDGRVASAKAAKHETYLKEVLELDAGAKRVGEFAFGLNEGIRRFTGNILFDEKIGGTMHLALGLGYPETGSKNHSAIHWDMICDLRRETEITADGEAIYRNGQFLA